MSYTNCADAYAHGVSDIPRGDPSYAAKLDGDNDGVGCETKDAPAGFVPKAVTSHAPGVQQQGTLPVTGPATEASVAGGLLLAVGAACLLLARRQQALKRAHNTPSV